MSFKKLFLPQYVLYYPAALLVAAVTYLVTLVDPLKYPLARFLSEGGGISGLPEFAVKLFTPAHVAAAVMLVALFFLIVYIERKSRSISAALLAGRGFPFYVFVAALFIWFSQAFLYPGVLLAGDSNFHIARIAHFRYGLEEARLIYWNNYWHLGMPEYQFTGPLLFWLGGVIDLLFSDPYFTAKLVLFVAQFSSGVFLFVYLRVLQLDRFASLIGAVAYCGAWAHLHMLLYKGALPQAIIFTLLPLGLLYIEKLARIKRYSTWYWPGLATVLAALFINHPSNGFFGALYLALYSLLSMTVGRFSWRIGPLLLSAAVAAILISLFLLVPVLVERDWVTMENPGSLISFVSPKLESLSYLLLWHYGNTGPGSNFFAYMGLSVLALAALNVYHLKDATPDQRRLLAVLLILWVLSFFLTGPHIRQSTFILLFTAILAGIGVSRITWKENSTMPALLILLLLLDLGTIAIQPVARTDKEYFATGAEELSRNHASERVLISASYSGDFGISIWDGGPMMSYPVQQLGVPFAYSVPMSHNYVAAAVKQAEHDLQLNKKLSKSSLDMLSLLNVGYIVNDNGKNLGFSEQYLETVYVDALGKAIPIAGATPVVFSTVLDDKIPEKILDKPILWDEEFVLPYPTRTGKVYKFLKSVIDEMGFDPESRTVSKIFIREASPIPKSESKGPLAARILDYKVDIGEVILKVESEDAGWARLAHAWYPALEVIHNGIKIEAFQDAIGQIVVPVVSGINEYSLTPTLTPLRQATLWISLIAFLGIWISTGALRYFQAKKRGYASE